MRGGRGENDKRRQQKLHVKNEVIIFSTKCSQRTYSECYILQKTLTIFFSPP